MNACRQMTRRFLVGALVVSMLAGIGSAVLSQDPANAPEDETRLLFHRIFVPEGEKTEWIKGFVPMTSAEFDELINVLRTAQQSAPRVEAVIEQAVYRAHLVGDTLIGDEALLDIRHSSESEVAMPLPGLRVAVGSATWQADEPQPAVLALSNHQTPLLMVDRSGQFRFTWSLRGRRQAFGEYEFELGLPACPASRLILDLPEGVRPLVAGAVATEVAHSGSTQGAGVNKSPSHRWVIDLGNEAEANHLRIVNDEPLTRGLALLRQAEHYSLNRTYGEFAAELQLDVHHEPLRHLTIEFDSAMAPPVASIGGKEVQATMVPGDPAKGAMSQLILHFDKPLLGTNRVVMLQGVFRIEADRMWKLPRVAVLGATWQEGMSTIRFHHPLVLEQLVTRRCRQAGVAELSAPERGESVTVQHEEAAAEIDLQTSYVQRRLQVAMGTSIEVDPVGADAQVHAEVRSVQGKHFAVEAIIPSDWTIASVESEPADALLDYRVVRRLGEQLITLRLNTPITPEQAKPLRIKINANRRLPALGATLGMGSFRVVRFVDSDVSQRLCSLPVAFFRLAADIGLARLDPAQLTEQQSGLLDSPDATRLVFVDDDNADRLQLKLDREQPRYFADVGVAVTVDANSITEDYRIQCRPQASLVGQLLVHFSPARQQDLQWSLAGEGLSAVRLGEEAQRRYGISRGETWLLTLKRPRKVPFEIRATRTAPLRGRRRVALAAVPLSETQLGTIEVHTKGSADCEIESRGLKPIPMEPLRSNEFTNAQARFRFEPSQDAQLFVAPASEENRQPKTWAWSLDLTTRVTLTGAAHQATYRLENTGVRQLQIRLPANVELESLFVEGTEVRATANTTNNTLVAALPIGKRYPTIEINYIEKNVSLSSMIGNLRAAIPEVESVPVLVRRWTVWVPPGYAARASEQFQPPRHLTLEAAGERLFGPLWRSSDRTPFSLFSAESWSNLTNDTSHGAAALRDADRFLDALGRLQEELSAFADASVSWQQLLASYDRSAQSAAVPRLMIDVAALRDAGLLPESQVAVSASPASKSARETALAILESSNLAVISSGGSVILTTPSSLRFHRADLLTSPYSMVALQGTASPLLVGSPESFDGLFSVADWEKRGHFVEVWGGSSVARDRNVEFGGWTAYQVPLNVAPLPTIIVYQPSVVEAMGWAALLITAAGVFWSASRRRIRLTWTLGIAATIALVMPDPLTPVTTGAMLGALLAAALVFAADRIPSRAASLHAAASSGDSVSTFQAATLVLMLGVVFCGRAVLADELKPDRKFKLYQVVVPVDDDEQPTSGYVYLPRPFYEAIHRRKRLLQAQLPVWHLMKSSYACALERPNDGVLTAGEMIATFDLDVLRESAEIVLPLRREDCDLSPNGALLDGEPAEVRFSSNGESLVVTVEEPGRHIFQLTFRPRITSQDETVGISVAIPKLVQSELRVAVPRDARDIQFPSALGGVERDARGEFFVRVGPSGELSMRWPKSVSRRKASEFEVSQLNWLKVAPGKVELDALFRISSAANVEALQLLADRRLQIAQAPAGHVVKDATDPGGETKSLHIQLDTSQPDWRDVRLRFLVTGASGVGNIRLPRLAAVQCNTTSRMLAVSVSPLLQSNTSHKLEVLKVTQFLEAWGGPLAGEPVDSAYLLTEGENPWSLSTSRRDSSTVAELKTHVSVSRRSISLDLRAELRTVDGYAYQHQLKVPREFRPTRVTLLSDDADRVARWSQNDDGVLTIRLGQRVAGDQTLQVEGTLPQNSGNFKLQHPTLLNADTKSSEVHFYRQADVGVELVRSSLEDKLPENDRGRFESPWGRRVAVVASGEASRESTSDNSTLRVRPNDPQVRCKTVTTLRKNVNQWTAEIDCLITIAEGDLDEFWFEYPPSWSDPRATDPDLEVSEFSVPGNDRRRIVVRPRRAARGRLRFAIRGTLVPAITGERITVPAIRPLECDVIEQFVAVPQQADSQRFTWSPSHLQAATLPPEFDASQLPDAPVVWQVIDSRYRATIKNLAQSAGVPPQVRLADIHFAWNADRSCHGLVLFDLEPAGLRSCVLQLPESFDLVQASVSGRPALIEALDRNRWRLSLGPDQLPQRLVVLYAGKLAERPQGTDRTVIKSPRLVDLSVERTLWTLYGPEDSDGAALVEPASSSTPQRHLMERFETTSQIIARASDVALESPPNEIDAWYGPWARRLIVARDAVRAELAASTESEIDTERIDALQHEQEEVTERLGVAQVLALATPTAGSAQLWSDLQRSTPVRCTITGTGGGKVVVSERKNNGRNQHWWLAVALASLTTTGIVYLGARFTPFPDWLARCPQAAGVLLGLTWWLWLSPSLLGWVIVLMSVITALRRPWKSKGDSGSGRSSPSTVLRQPAS